MKRLRRVAGTITLWLKGVTSSSAALGSVGGVPYIVLALLGGGLALTVATALWYLQTHRPLSEAPGVSRLPGVSAQRAAPPFLFAIYGLEKPIGVAVSPDGRTVYGAESEGQHLVHAFDRSGKEVATLAPPDSTPAQRRPAYLAVGPGGKLYVSDLLRNEVDIFGPDGGYQGVLRPSGLESSLWQPLALAFDRSGTLYVTETTPGQHRALAMDADGRVKAQFGREGKGPGELSFPNGLAVDGKGLVYVSDSSNSRMQVLDPRSGFTSVFQKPEGFSMPRGAGVDGDRLYVADTVGDSISVFALESAPRYLYSFGDEGRADGRFLYPEGLAIDPSGRVYVADRENNRIQVFGYQ